MNVNSVATTTAVDLAKPLTIFTASSGTISPTLGSGQEMGEIHNFIAKGAQVVKLQTDNNINSVADSVMHTLDLNKKEHFLYNGMVINGTC